MRIVVAAVRTVAVVACTEVVACTVVVVERMRETVQTTVVQMIVAPESAPNHHRSSVVCACK